MKRICEFCGKEYDYEKKKSSDNHSSLRYCCGKCRQNDSVRKARITKLKRYGDANYNNQDKSRQTCLMKYGVEYTFQSDNNKEKTKVTNLNKYGVAYITQLDSFKEKAKKSKKDKYGSETYNNPEKIKQTFMTNYGVENPGQVDAVKAKIRATNLKRYGYINAMQNPIIMQRSNDRRKELKTYSKSKEEDVVFQLLSNKFKKVERQYRSEKYPFACDFYIPEKDLYIEYQGHWSHGKDGRKILGPYNKVDTLHQRVLESWQKKSEIHPQFTAAIKVWTEVDPLKRHYAKSNSLNWHEFFTIKEIKDWINNM